MLGNDVVDLSDPETSDDAIHPRFDARVFTDRERDAIASHVAPGELRWSLWAAKESAYKLLRQRDSNVIFSPREFEVDLDVQQRGEVRFNGERFSVRVCRSGSALHAICTRRCDEKQPIAVQAMEICDVLDEGEADLSPSIAVRRLAVRSVAEELAIDPKELSVVCDSNRVPHFQQSGNRLGLALSLSHHGRYVAFACRLSRDTSVSGSAA